MTDFPIWMSLLSRNWKVRMLNTEIPCELFVYLLDICSNWWCNWIISLYLLLILIPGLHFQLGRGIKSLDNDQWQMFYSFSWSEWLRFIHQSTWIYIPSKIHVSLYVGVLSPLGNAASLTISLFWSFRNKRTYSIYKI